MWQEESDDSSNDSEDDIMKAAHEAEESETIELSLAEGAQADSNHGSDYEHSEVESHESEEEKSSVSSSSEENSDSSPPRAKKNNSRRLDEDTRRLLEENNYLRRSSRCKTQETGKAKAELEESESGDSEGSWSESDEPKRKKVKSNKKTSPSYKGIRNASRKNVDYTEKDTDEDIDENDVLEWEEEKPIPTDLLPTAPAETIERVIKYRIGVIGATGSHTTCYNSEKNDPLTNLDRTKTEDQYLIKWVGWSHLHNTWESESSLNASGVGGIKKVHNFVKKQKQIDLWRRTADKEYVEFFDCEQFMNEQLCEEYTKVERIVAHQVSREKSTIGASGNEYFVKWNGLSYSDCTWEDEKLLPADRLAEYHRRIENFKQPNKNAAALRRRPKFVKLEKTPTFLREGGEGVEGRDLRDYQLEGLNWMLHAWCKNNSCILADEMGLGKTIQSISFLSALTHRYEVYGPFLVVVPLSTMAAWQREFVNWASDMNVVVYMGDSSSREQIRQFEWYNSNKKLKLNACLTTYEILLKDKSFLGSFEWAALAVDEAHRLKNDESLLYKCLSQFSCDHRLLITGTPLQNSIKELWALLHFIMPDKFESWEEFEYDHNDKDHKGISALHRKLEPYLLRRVKKDVEKSLPPKLEQILRVDMTAQQKQFYKWILTKNYRELSKGVKGSINGFVNLVMELKKCCNHASLVRHYDYHEGEAQARLQQLLKSSGKLILLDKLLCRLKETGHRVLIFSQMVMMLDILQEYLQLRRFPSQRLDGSMRADLRKQALDHFNAEGSTDFCFLLSTRAGGLGINLATADTVIIFDSDWNPQNDLQAMSRAHRIGQTRQVNIYRLVTRASVEEEIVERAKRKLVLDHLVIQRMDTSGRTVLSKTTAGSVPFDKHELNNILKFGAAELFKESEGEEQEPEVDIDRILLGAETRDAEEENVGPMDLLSSFKYANFVIDEERDVAEAAAQKHEDWDQIIPEERRVKVEEEERQKGLADLELAPRNRNKQFTERNVVTEDDDGDNTSDSETETSKRRKKKPWGDFSSAEIKKFVRAFRKFSMPLERLEAIAQEAELEDRSTSEIHKITEALLEGCKKCEDDYNAKKENVKEKEKKDGDKVKDRGPTFKFAGVVDVNVKQIRKMHNDLKPLHDALAGDSSSSDFKAPPRARPQKGWDVEWSSVDDGALLRGVFKYGMGSWESIKMDPDLGLADKIFLKDKVKKPQRSNVQQRVDYLLKLMNTRPVNTNTERKRKAPEHSNNVTEKKSRSVKFTKEWLEEQLFLLKINKTAYAHDLDNTNDRPFTQCVKMMRSVQKYIKRLAQGDKKSDPAKCLCRLGDNCRDQLGLMVKKRPDTNLEKWYNYLWIFLSKFTSKEPNEMLNRYRELVRAKSKGREHKSKDKVDKTAGREKRAEKEKRSEKDKEKEKKDRKSSRDHKDKKEHKSHKKDKEKEKDNHERKHHIKQSSKPRSGHNKEVEKEQVLQISTLASN